MIYRASRSSAQEYNTTLFIANETDNKHLGVTDLIENILISFIFASLTEWLAYKPDETDLGDASVQTLAGSCILCEKCI